jgi:hypothetical protein
MVKSRLKWINNAVAPSKPQPVGIRPDLDGVGLSGPNCFTGDEEIPARIARALERAEAERTENIIPSRT